MQVCLKVCPFTLGLSWQALWKGARLHFQFYKEAQRDQPQAAAQDAGGEGGLKTIKIQRMDQVHEAPHDVLQKLVARYQVPEAARYGNAGTMCPHSKYDSGRPAEQEAGMLQGVCHYRGEPLSNAPACSPAIVSLILGPHLLETTLGQMQYLKYMMLIRICCSVPIPQAQITLHAEYA